MIKSRLYFFARQGFTLLEVLLVVALAALLTTAAGGIYLKSFQKQRVRQAAREFVLAAQYARLIAVENQNKSILEIDRQNSHLRLTVLQMNPQTHQEDFIAISNEYFRPAKLPDSVVFEHVVLTPRQPPILSENGLGDEILFYPDGTSDGAMVQIGDGAIHYTIQISSPTGRAVATLGVGQWDQQVIDLDEQ